MSKLRKQLQHARNQYQHQRYRGDLAADVLDRLTLMKTPSYWRRGLALAAALALLATAGLWLMNRDTATEEVAGPNPSRVETVNEVAPPVDNTPEAPALATNDEETEAVEERLSLVPSGLASASETSFSLVPSLSSYDESSLEAVPDDTVDQ